MAGRRGDGKIRAGESYDSPALSLLGDLPFPGSALPSGESAMEHLSEELAKRRASVRSSSLDAQETSVPLNPRVPDYVLAAWNRLSVESPGSSSSGGGGKGGQPGDVLARPCPLQSQSTAQRIHHKRWMPQRVPIVRAMAASSCPAIRKRAEKLGLCCCIPTLRKKEGKGIIAAMQRCRDRLCPLCGWHRGKWCAVKAAEIVRGFNSPRFITLTTRGNDKPLLLRLRHLFCSFRELRKRREWNEWVKGGIYALEVTWNQKTMCWHPHLHILVDGEFIPQQQLKKIWLEITRDSLIVDVRSVRDREKAATYIASYVAKPANVHNWPASKICEYAIALKGARMLQCFGSAYARDVEKDDEDAVPTGSSHLVHGCVLAGFARNGSRAAKEAQAIISRMSRTHAAAVEIDPETVDYTVSVSEEEARFAERVCARTQFLYPCVADDLDVAMRVIERKFERAIPEGECDLLDLFGSSS